MPKVLGASGFDLDKDELIVGVDCDNIDFAANLFVLQPGGRSPIAVDDAVAVRLKDAADHLFAPASDAVGSGQGPRDRGGVLPGASRASAGRATRFVRSGCLCGCLRCDALMFGGHDSLPR